MKQFCFFLLIFSLQNGMMAQLNPFEITASNDSVPCTGGCISLVNSTILTNNSNNYLVQTIPYTPYDYIIGTNILVNTDDIWSPSIPIGFDFCFYGNTYQECVIGANGLISFDVAQYAGLYCQWPINAQIPINANSAPTNSIMCPWHDLDPSIGGSTQYKMYGTAPFRAFVISWSQIPLFAIGCNNLLCTQQIVLYETSNMIETYIENKPLCASWNGGAAIHGIQNIDGTQAAWVAGRNFPAQWSATNDAWRFVPPLSPAPITNWYQNGILIATADSIQLCPTENTLYSMDISFISCLGDTFFLQDSIEIAAASPSFQVNSSFNNVTCFGGTNGVISFMAQGNPVTYTWTPNVSTNAMAVNLSAGNYIVSINDTGTCNYTQAFTITEPPQNTIYSISINPAHINTFDGAVTVDGIGPAPFTYSWHTTPPVYGNTCTSLDTGFIAVTMTDGNGCTVTDSFYVFATTVGVDISAENMMLKVYPNPAQDLLYIDLPQSMEKTEINIYSILGEKVLSEVMENHTNPISLSLPHLPKGIYSLQVRQKGNNYGTKLIISDEK